jgi:lactose/L-arabinose transport system permease protein
MNIQVSPTQNFNYSSEAPAASDEGLYRSQSRWGLLFVSPFFLLFAVFGLFPLIFSFILSFSDWNGRGDISYIGLENLNLILQDRVFWQSMLNGIQIFILYTPIQIMLSLGLAVLLNSKRVRGFRLFRTLFNQILAAFSIAPLSWLDTPWTARISLVLLVMWAWVGYHMIIMLAGLQTIPQDLNEAATVDGASPLQVFVHITIPLMRPVLLFSLVLSTIGSFNLFTELVSLFPSTGGSGPLNSTITPGLYIFNQGFRNFRFGYASAVAYVYFILVFLIMLVERRFFGRDNT